MITVGDKVVHVDSEINSVKGVMVVFEIKNGFAICGYADYNRVNRGINTFKVSDLKKIN
jgi:hypothetical protein